MRHFVKYFARRLWHWMREFISMMTSNSVSLPSLAFQSIPKKWKFLQIGIKLSLSWLNYTYHQEYGIFPSESEKQAEKNIGISTTHLQSTNLCLKKINLLKLRFNRILLKEKNLKFAPLCYLGSTLGTHKVSPGILLSDAELKSSSILLASVSFRLSLPLLLL